MKTEFKREKKQFLVLMISLIVLLIPLGIIPWAVHLENKVFSSLALLPLFFLFFLASSLYCVIRYRMFRLTPEFICRDIVANINDSIILIDHKKTIITANEKTKSLIGYNEIAGKDISAVIFEKMISDEAGKLLKDDIIPDFSCKFHFSGLETKIPMDAKFSIVKDRFGDVLGILIVSREIKEIGQLKLYFKVTGRETEIIQHIVSGYSNPEIAGKMGITENTVKRHITNIYNKFNCNNKIQLLTVLKDYHIMPDQKAGRTIFTS